MSRARARSAGARFGAALIGLLGLVACGEPGTTLHVSGTGAAKSVQASASASASEGSDGVQQVTVLTNDDDHFVPDAIYAHTGQLRVTIMNPSVSPQEFEVPTLGVHSETIFAGHNLTLTLNIPASGVYDFDCIFHEHDGMTGQLIIS